MYNLFRGKSQETDRIHEAGCPEKGGEETGWCFGLSDQVGSRKRVQILEGGKKGEGTVKSQSRPYMKLGKIKGGEKREQGPGRGRGSKTWGCHCLRPIGKRETEKPRYGKKGERERGRVRSGELGRV